MNYLSDTPAPFLDGLPSPLAADTTHPEGHASSAHRHSPQGQGNPGHPMTITHSTDNSTKTLRLEDSQLLQRPSTSSSWDHRENRSSQLFTATWHYYNTDINLLTKLLVDYQTKNAKAVFYVFTVICTQNMKHYQCLITKSTDYTDMIYLLKS